VKHPRYPWHVKAKEKQMTIAAGFVVRDGIVLCTDSLYSGGIKVQGKKIFALALNGGAVAFALAGHEPFAKRAIEECCSFLDENRGLQSSVAGIKGTIEAALKKFHEEFVFSRPKEERERVGFELLVAAASLNEKPAIFSAYETVLIPVSGYRCFGMGCFVGQHVIETAYSPKMSLDDAVVLAIHATAVAKEYVEGVGGPTQLLWIKDGVVSPFHPLNTAVFTETYIMSFEQRSAELLFDAANPRLSADEFKQKADNFVTHLGLIRKHWRQSFENKDILEMLMYPGPADPPHPKSD